VSKLINLFGGPGIGKSSISAGVFYELKRKHISCNNPYEFPKRLAWDNNMSAIKDQLYVLGNQHRGIAECYGKVDYIVIDSPVLFSLIYKTWYSKGYPSEFYSESFNQMILDLHNNYNNINILLERSVGEHNDDERYQSLEDSIKIDVHCKKILDSNNIDYHTIRVDENTVTKIIKLIGLPN
tara:strand:+ start:556 stop:1101 length:546 start_codon:yes stop_codon:yes gene_type:complete